MAANNFIRSLISLQLSFRGDPDGHADAIRAIRDAVNADGPEAMRAWLVEDHIRRDADR